eukprot:scaffold393652_cov31-Prasinocladus_malaysianus.AAC.1
MTQDSTSGTAASYRRAATAFSLPLLQFAAIPACMNFFRTETTVIPPDNGLGWPFSSEQSPAMFCRSKNGPRCIDECVVLASMCQLIGRQHGNCHSRTY